MCEFKSPDKRRPVLVLTRQSAIQFLHTVTVAPITSVIRGIPSEVLVGVEHGLKKQSSVNLDHMQTIEQARLRTFVGTLPIQKMAEVCRAIGVATGCR